MLNSQLEDPPMARSCSMGDATQCRGQDYYQGSSFLRHSSRYVRLEKLHSVAETGSKGVDRHSRDTNMINNTDKVSFSKSDTELIIEEMIIYNMYNK